MCASTKPMKMMPLTAMRSFSAMVERVDLLFLTRVAVATASPYRSGGATGSPPGM